MTKEQRTAMARFISVYPFSNIADLPSLFVFTWQCCHINE